MAGQSEKIPLGKVLGNHEIKKIKRELDALPGVLSVAVSGDKTEVTVDYDSTGICAEKINKAVCGICRGAASGERADGAV